MPIRLFLPEGPPTLVEPDLVIDEATAAAGRDPSAVRRILTFPGRFSRLRGGLLDGPPTQWAEELADMALHYGVGRLRPRFRRGGDDRTLRGRGRSGHA